MSIFKSIDYLATAINNLASAIRSKNTLNNQSYYKPDNSSYTAKESNYIKNKTSNPTQYTTSTITYTAPKEFVTILKSEHEVIGALYKALTTNDPEKAKNDQVMLDIKQRWPKLYYALIDVISAKTFAVYKGFTNE